MKRTIFLLLILAAGFSSCKKFLEEVPRDQVTNATYYASEADIVASVDGIYNAARFEASSGLPIMFPLEQMSDDGAYSTSTNFVAERSQLDIITFTSANTVIGGIWSRSYTVINRANNVIKFATDSSRFKPKTIRLAQAQAKFFRAFYHFRLAQIFGDIPLMTQPADVAAGNIFPSRTAVRIVYDSVISDLKYARDNLDSAYAYNSSNGGRVTIAAAKALLGKVYLTMAGYPLNNIAGYQLAIDELRDLIDNKARYNIDLNPVFANIFTPIVGTKQLDKERIYFIRGTSGLANSLQAFTRMGWTFRTFRYTTPSKDFATDAALTRRVYETGDARRNVSVSNFALSNFSSSLVSKYNSTNNDDASDDLILLRYADVLMMTAEAMLEIGGTPNLDAALAIINNVRRTHGSISLPLLTYSSQADLRTKLRQERRREFAFECSRWFDLKRWDVLIPTIKASLADYYNKPISDYDFLDNPDPNRYKVLPIPIQEIANNPNMTQNPGY
ncbi:MAG: RagB/SusD family nutrient uptake outer membrane protein [Dinghuibacter sp.]|nr:RagB/SusD family nutrient uptake outer membrane protein [Dinghuibacter sp.]